jgi:(p)ppGpp synthase/HD superfamily hydrolase
MKCIGAKINNKLMPLSYKLKSGDQIEVLTSSKQYPKEDWLNFVVTGKAKSKIKQALKDEKRQLAEEGKEILERKFRNLKVKPDNNTINRLVKYYKMMSPLDFYYRIANKNIDLNDLKEALEDPDKKRLLRLSETFYSGLKREEEKPHQIENLVADLNGKLRSCSLATT